MIFSVTNLAMYAPLLALLTWAAVTDLRWRRIPNWVSLTTVIAGIAQSFTRFAVTTPGSACGGLAAGFAATFVLYVLGARGAGDVKLTAGIGAWIGPVPVLLVLAAAAVVSLIVAVVQTAISGKLTELFKNATVMLVNLLNVRRLGTQHVKETARTQPPSVGRPLPNAVSMLIATAGFVVWICGKVAG